MTVNSHFNELFKEVDVLTTGTNKECLDAPIKFADIILCLSCLVFQLRSDAAEVRALKWIILNRYRFRLDVIHVPFAHKLQTDIHAYLLLIVKRSN